MPAVAQAVLGGALIGLAAGLDVLGSGRIAGISGIFGSLLSGPREPARLLFLLGLLFAPPLAWLAGAPSPAAVPAPASPGLLLVAALLTGLGTALGSGCTSGHGVCGIANASPRGVIATLTFMAAAIATVALQRALA